MCNLIEYSSNISKSTGSVWFCSKDEVTDFSVDIANTDNFKYFMYKAKLLENTVVGGANGILKNGTIALPLKYLSNFWISLEMTLLNSKVELKP